MIKIGIYLQWRQLERFWRPGLYDLRCIKMMGDCDHILGRTMSRMTSSPGHWGLVTRLMMSEEEMLPGVSPEWCLLPAWLCPDWRSQSRRLERSLAELLRLRWRSLTTLCLVCLHCPPTILTPTLRLWSFNRNFQTFSYFYSNQFFFHTFVTIMVGLLTFGKWLCYQSWGQHQSNSLLTVKPYMTPTRLKSYHKKPFISLATATQSFIQLQW